MTKKPKIVTDISERNMEGRKVCIELDGPVGADGSTIKINGWVVAQLAGVSSGLNATNLTLT